MTLRFFIELSNNLAPEILSILFFGFFRAADSKYRIKLFYSRKLKIINKFFNYAFNSTNLNIINSDLDSVVEKNTKEKVLKEI